MIEAPPTGAFLKVLAPGSGFVRAEDVRREAPIYERLLESDDAEGGRRGDGDSIRVVWRGRT